MYPNTTENRINEIRKSWQAWCYLHHLLSSNVLRETIFATVDAIANGNFGFTDLFDEELSSGDGALSSWLIRPKPVDSDLASHVQIQMRAIGWMNDTNLEPRGDAITRGTIALNASLDLSHTDLTAPSEEIEHIKSLTDQAEFHTICDILRSCISNRKNKINDYSSTIGEINRLPQPLNAMFVKHIGDLYADQDEWEAALLFYKTGYETSNIEESCWHDLLHSLRQLLQHSIATATWMIEGSAAAYQYLDVFYDVGKLSEKPLLICNSSHDLLMAHNRTPGDTWKADLRAVFIPPPLLLNSHDLENALSCSIVEDFESAFKKYWAILRRQIALGSFSDRLQTQKLYAHSLLTATNSGKYTSPKAFSLGVELLLCSAADSIVEKIEWTERAVNQNVNRDFITELIEKQRRYKGVSIERGRTLISLIGNWIELFDIEHAEEATILMCYIIQMANENESSFYSWRDLFTPSIKMLIRIRNRRPEFSRIVAKDVGSFIISKLNGNHGGWNELSSILELSTIYLHDIDECDKKEIILFAANVINKSNANLMWPLLDATLSLLYSEVSYSLCEADKEAGSIIVAAVMRSGIVSERDQAQFIANFKKFPISLVNSDPRRPELDEIIESVRKGLSVLSSSAIPKIHAFLLVPELVGKSYFLEAVQALKGLLKSVLASQNKILMVEIFSPIRVLAHQILENKESEIVDARDECFEIFDSIIEIWNFSVSHPRVFSSLSIPRKISAEQIVVHNWAVATFELGRSLGKADVAESVLNAARIEKQLVLGIDQARGTTAQFYGYSSLDFEIIKKSGKDSFYSTLGRYLAVMSQAEEKESFLRLFGEKIFEFGPREADATVLLLAIQLKNNTLISDSRYPDYKHRVNLSNECRSLLGPLILELEKNC